MIQTLRPYFLFFLLVFHIVGFLLFTMYPQPMGLSGLNILICSALVFASVDNMKDLISTFLVCYIGGMTVEIIGVNTGWLFGSYEYGSELGPKLAGVPFVLGLNWFCIVLASTSVVQYFLYDSPKWFIAILSGILCVLFDYVLEPVAIRFDFWHWAGGDIPIFNYICWGIFCAIFSYFYIHKIENLNKLAFYLFFIWTVFFSLLSWV